MRDHAFLRKSTDSYINLVCVFVHHTKRHHMNKVVFIISFQYSGKRYLPGAAIDVYHAYKWARGITNSIYVFTDFSLDNIEIPSCVLDDKIVEEDVVTLFKIIGRMVTSGNNKDDLLSWLHNISWSNRVIIYYSGHGKKKELLLPNGEQLCTHTLRDVIKQETQDNCEVFIIYDCCNPNNLDLPFQLKGNTFVNADNMLTAKFCKQKILLMASSRQEEKSVATPYGSLFTRHLFNTLRSLDIDQVSDMDMSTWLSLKNRNLSRLAGRLIGSIRKENSEKPQTVSIYSSHMQDPVLWLWLGTDVDVSCHPSITALVIRGCSQNVYDDRYDNFYLAKGLHVREK